MKGMQGEIIRCPNTNANAISDAPFLEGKSRTSVSAGDFDGEEN